ncbi:MAG: divalent-cation tolerance protein CutA [Candidatus Solibacter usitatus]|nr:divalent-cation tolerance protein CutA [Candidatus Solibacter usitatus]
MTEKLVVFCTCASPDEAEKIARTLVEKQLAACVNILPAVRSIYRWQGNVEDTTEVLLLIKTRQAVYPDLEKEIRKLHSYSAPEIVAIVIDRGSAAYLDWIAAETSAIQ